MHLDFMARSLSLSLASHMRHKHESQPEWETSNGTREDDDILSHQEMGDLGTMLRSEAQRMLDPYHGSAGWIYQQR